MAQKREIAFWQRHMETGSWVGAVRTYRERAIKFFGAEAVLREDEAALFRGLEAQTILARTDRELLVEMNRVLKEVVKGEDLTIAEVKTLKKLGLRTSKDVTKLKNEAQRYLARVTGRSDI